VGQKEVRTGEGHCGCLSMQSSAGCQKGEIRSSVEGRGSQKRRKGGEEHYKNIPLGPRVAAALATMLRSKKRLKIKREDDQVLMGRKLSPQGGAEKKGGKKCGEREDGAKKRERRGRP